MLRNFLLVSLLFLGYDDDPKDLQWNRYVTKNFEILSLDDAQGKYLSGNVEYIKTWVLWRWGVKDVEFKKPCKLICVPSTPLNARLFGKNVPVVKSDENGTIIWMISEQPKWHSALAGLITEAAVTNLESVSGKKLPLWCRRGMSVLNGRVSDIKMPAKVDTKWLMDGKPTEAQKATYDAQAAAFCLWVRTEYNGKVFLDVLSDTSEQGLQKHLGLGYSAADAKIQSFLQKADKFTW